MPDPQRFGIATLDDRRQRRPASSRSRTSPPTDLALVGVYLFDRWIHDAVRAIAPSARGELEITDAIQWLIDNGHRVRTEQLEGWWIDTGKLTPLLEANRLLLESVEPSIEGDVDAETSAGRSSRRRAPAPSIRRSRIRGPVAIATGACITDSFIGPFTAIGERCRITNSEIEHSVVMAGQHRVATSPGSRTR